MQKNILAYPTLVITLLALSACATSATKMASDKNETALRRPASDGKTLLCMPTQSEMTTYSLQKGTVLFLADVKTMSLALEMQTATQNGGVTDKVAENLKETASETDVNNKSIFLYQNDKMTAKVWTDANGVMTVRVLGHESDLAHAASAIVDATLHCAL